MTITLDLPEELEKELSAEANELGLSLSEYALRVLATGLVVGNRPKTGAELVAYWQAEALIGTRSEITDSQAQARAIRAEAERRIRT
jgi:hypothetical protein